MKNVDRYKFGNLVIDGRNNIKMHLREIGLEGVN
jgi:hypothetical protein